jgi:selenocysteine lyase/cysteine desulfurase
MNSTELIRLPSKSAFTIGEIQKLRNETAGTKNVIHFNNAGSGLMPDVVTQAQLDHIKLESEIGGYEAAAVRADILDACQSAGQMKLDVQRLQCDFLSITCRKFLRGPRGTGALYISDRALEANLEPMFIDMRGAEWTARDQYIQQPDAKRFEDWEFAYSTVMGTKVAIEYCLNIGEEKIWQQVKLLSGITRQRLAEIEGIRVLDRGAEQGGLVTFTVEDSDPVFIVSELLKRKINVVPTYRAFGLIDFDEKGVKWAVRASPHYYNTLNEIDTFIESVKEIIA